jgi:hypothetical protein
VGEGHNRGHNIVPASAPAEYLMMDPQLSAPLFSVVSRGKRALTTRHFHVQLGPFAFLSDLPFSVVSRAKTV